MSRIIRAGMLCLVAGCLGLLSGCCGVCGGVCQVYQHPAPSCVGLHYAGCCTCTDEYRDTVNQLTDILIPNSW